MTSFSYGFFGIFFFLFFFPPFLFVQFLPLPKGGGATSTQKWGNWEERRKRGGIEGEITTSLK